MKKVILLIMILASAVTAQGQISWQVKAGYGTTPRLDDYNSLKKSIDDVFFGGNSVYLGASVDIPLRKHSRWIISPGLNANIGVGDHAFSSSVYSSALVGYRVRMGRFLFVPKLGVALGVELPKEFDYHYTLVDNRRLLGIDCDESGVGSYSAPNKPFIGPQVDLAFEFGHFVFDVNMAFSPIRCGLVGHTEWTHSDPGCDHHNERWFNYYEYSQTFPMHANVAIGYRF